MPGPNPTAYAVLDRPRIHANIRRFQQAAARAGVQVRAHVNAHRSPELARRQLRGGAVGVAVGDVREAERYAGLGVTDLVIIAPGHDPSGADRIARLARESTVTVHVADASGIAMFDTAAARHEVRLRVRIELDTGRGTSGAHPGHAGDLARLVGHADHLRLDGVTGYHGVRDEEQARRRHDIGRAQALLLVEVAESLRRDGHRCRTVCSNGTATASGSLTVRGVTEICSGVYATYDAGMAALGVCRYEDVAIAVAGPPSEVAGLVAGCEQPWTADVVATEHDGSPFRPNGSARARVLPVHMCPLSRRFPAYAVESSPGSDAGRWAIHRR